MILLLLFVEADIYMRIAFLVIFLPPPVERAIFFPFLFPLPLIFSFFLADERTDLCQ